MGGWIGEVPDPLGSPYSDCLILGCVGRLWSLSRAEFFSRFCFRGQKLWHSGCLGSSWILQEARNSLPIRVAPNDRKMIFFSHILLPLETPTLS